MKRLGLTGGIASGKSAAARWMRAQGLPVLDADRESRRVVERGEPALQDIAQRWPLVVSPEGELDRERLGAIVFSDAAERRALEAIVLPRIRDNFERWSAALEARGEPVCVFEAALLFEQGLAPKFDGVLLIAARPEVQLARLMKRDGFEASAAQQRLDAQWPLDRKRPLATWVIDNDGSLQTFEEQLGAWWHAVRASL